MSATPSAPLRLIREITGTDTPTSTTSAHLCMGGGKGMTLVEYSGPGGKAHVSRSGDELIVAWGESFVRFKPTPKRRLWAIVEEQRVR